MAAIERLLVRDGADRPTGETTIFVYNAFGKLIGEYGGVIQTGSNAKTIFTTNDHLGSPRIKTDGTGQVVSRHDYHPFGEEITRSGYGSDSIRKRFTGYERDGETGLDFAQARYYASVRGRFTSPDLPFAGQDSRLPQSWNLYVYCGNNPILFTDPTGRWHWVDPDKNGKRFLQWDEDDTWETLQQFLMEQTDRYHSIESLEFAFGGGGLGEDVIVDKTGLESPGIPARGHGLQDASDDIIPLGRVGKPARGLWPVIKKAPGWIASFFTKKGVKKVAKGVLSGAVDQLNKAEREIAEELVEQGKNVVVIPRASHKTADFVVDGVETELKTLTTAGANTMKNAIETASEQGKTILINARNVSYSADDALQQIRRAEGNLGTSLKGRVTVLTKDGPVEY